MSAYYSDITTAEGREEFLTTTQQPTPIPELPATNSPVDNLDAIFMEMLPLPNEAQPQAEENAQAKRSYLRVSQNDRNDLNGMSMAKSNLLSVTAKRQELNC